MTVEKKKRNGIYLVAGLLLTALLLYTFNRLLFNTEAVRVEVSVEGTIIETFDLDETVDQVISGYGGGTNHLIIKDGGVSIAEASCPDKVCVRQGIITETGQSLVCLPNKLIVTLK